jgi:hypothetical protein
MRPIDITPQTEIELWKMQEEGNAKKSTKRKNEIPLMNYVRI